MQREVEARQVRVLGESPSKAYSEAMVLELAVQAGFSTHCHSSTKQGTGGKVTGALILPRHVSVGRGLRISLAPHPFSLGLFSPEAPR